MPDRDVTLLLHEAQRGSDEALGKLIEAVFGELRRMAADKMRAERPDHTLQATALVNEAFLRLIGAPGGLRDRAYFFGAAAKAMERVLIDHARAKAAAKRGGGARPITFHDLAVASADARADVIEVHQAIARLEAESPDLAELVRCRYFLGMTLEEIAGVSSASLATVKRRWTFARAWLYDQLAEHDHVREA